MDAEAFWIETAAWLLFAALIVALIINRYDMRDIMKPKGYQKL
jgi:hypothetical protein